MSLNRFAHDDEDHAEDESIKYSKGTSPGVSSSSPDVTNPSWIHDSDANNNYCNRRRCKNEGRVLMEIGLGVERWVRRNESLLW